MKIDSMGRSEQLTQSEENYIKAIFALSEQTDGSISTNLLADRMATKASSVTDMLKRLSDKDLLTYQKYQGCSLTDSGRIIAISIVRKHRLWEYFLVDKLQFGWDEVHEIAEQLEHIQSQKLTNKLEEFLGFPKIDPHGDPIPNRDGKFDETTIRTCLSEHGVGTRGIVMGVKDGAPDFLQYLNRIGLKLGSEIEITDKLAFDGSLVVAVRTATGSRDVNQTQQLSQLAASRIFIQIL